MENDKNKNSTLCIADSQNEAAFDFKKQGFEQFKNPSSDHLNYFFYVHPIQPIDQATILPFDYKKFFLKIMM